MLAITQCRRLLATGKSLYQCHSDGVSATLRRMYHQYKPKDRPTLHETTQALDPHISRDVLLYRYEEPFMVFGKNMLAVTMLPLWAYLGYSAFTLKSDLDPYSESVNKPNFGLLLTLVQKASFGVGLGFLLFGTGLTGYWVSRTLKTVRRLILKKGGKHVTIVTYGLFGPYNRYSTFPIQHLSSIRHPDDGRMFLRVKDQYFKYQLNVDNGIFGNRPLFDRTIGLSRRM